MLGLFINTVPVRVRLDPQQTAEQMWARLQDQQSALLAYQHLGLAQADPAGRWARRGLRHPGGLRELPPA